MSAPPPSPAALLEQARRMLEKAKTRPLMDLLDVDTETGREHLDICVQVGPLNSHGEGAWRTIAFLPFSDEDTVEQIECTKATGALFAQAPVLVRDSEGVLHTFLVEARQEASFYAHERH